MRGGECRSPGADFGGRLRPIRDGRAEPKVLHDAVRLLTGSAADFLNDYFESEIRPLLGASDVEFVGEINEATKPDFLGNALALLFPIDWPEPFGLVMIEAMACGTPVIAFRRGSVPEIIEHGVSGFIVDDVDGAVQAVAQVEMLPRAEVRRCFERRFTAERMARDYLAIYRALTKGDVVERERLQDNEPALLRSAA